MLSGTEKDQGQELYGGHEDRYETDGVQDEEHV